MHRIFGTKENAEYLDREGVYLIPCRDNRVGVIRTPKGYFLLGGGLETGESHMECLRRECLEEAGSFPYVEGKLCSAEAYVEHATIGHYHPIQTYYCGKMSDREFTPKETDHILCWIEYDQIKGKMFLEMQNWALEQFFEHVE